MFTTERSTMKYIMTLIALIISFSATAASLKGSAESMHKQNEVADESDLSRIKNEEELKKFIASGILVPLPNIQEVFVDERLDARYRYVRPWTKKFLLDLGKKFYAKFGEGLQINSAVRTQDSQRDLVKKNKNAAKGVGKKASSHPTGATVDITKKGMSAPKIKWLRTELLTLEREGRIEATEEHSQSVFHIMVFKKH